ncbi:unnamed protein product [Closterium sp. NIES-64]|nr:unnamed protein product [Closterium sp. NIES-64]
MVRRALVPSDLQAKIATQLTQVQVCLFFSFDFTREQTQEPQVGGGANPRAASGALVHWAARCAGALGSGCAGAVGSGVWLARWAAGRAGAVGSRVRWRAGQ